MDMRGAVVGSRLPAAGDGRDPGLTDPEAKHVSIITTPATMARVAHTHTARRVVAVAGRWCDLGGFIAVALA